MPSAKELQDAIQRIPSVLSAELTGQRDEVLEIIVNKQKLEVLWPRSC